MGLGIKTQIRALSIIGLILFLGIVYTAILLILTNPGLIVLYIVAAVALISGGWLMLASKKFWWGVLLTAAATITLLAGGVYFLGQPGNLRRLLVLAVLSLAYLTVASYISKQYWQAKRAAHQLSPSQTHQPALIINPKSGNGRATKAGLAEKARAQGISVTVMQPGQDMVALAESAVAQGADILGISGGDGSLGIIAKVAMKHDLPMVVIPGGTRCHFARDIGLDPNKILDALTGFSGVERRVDVGLLDGRVFINNASFGLYAEITSYNEYREHKLETSQREIQRLTSSKHPYYPLELTDNNGVTWDHAALVLIGVNRYEVVRLGELGERKRLDGGELHVIALQALDKNIPKQLTARLSLSGTSTSPLVEWTTTNFSIAHSSGWLNAGVDGESIRVKSPVKLRLTSKALRLLVPPEGVRQRPVKPISIAGTRTLWDLITAKD